MEGQKKRRREQQSERRGRKESGEEGGMEATSLHVQRSLLFKMSVGCVLRPCWGLPFLPSGSMCQLQ